MSLNGLYFWDVSLPWAIMLPVSTLQEPPFIVGADLCLYHLYHEVARSGMSALVSLGGGRSMPDDLYHLYLRYWRRE